MDETVPLQLQKAPFLTIIALTFLIPLAVIFSHQPHPHQRNPKNPVLQTSFHSAPILSDRVSAPRRIDQQIVTQRFFQLFKFDLRPTYSHIDITIQSWLPSDSISNSLTSLSFTPFPLVFRILVSINFHITYVGPSSTRCGHPHLPY